MIQLYELVNKKEDLISFSPFVLAVKLFLKHKNLEFDTIPLTFIEVGPTISKLTDGAWSRVPLIKDNNGAIVYDSLKIGKYLEETYPDAPSLGINSPTLDQLIEDYDPVSDLSFSWAIKDLYNSLDEPNKVYFYPSREKMLGTSIEEFTSQLDDNLKAYHARTTNIGEILNKSNYLNGDHPGFYDYILIARLQFLRLISPDSFDKFIVNHPYPSINQWVERMLALFDNYLKQAKGVKDL